MSREDDEACAEALDIAQAQLKGWVAERKRLETVFAEKDALIADLIDALEDVVNQACVTFEQVEDGPNPSLVQSEVLDSMALSAYAHGMRVLARLGRIEIQTSVGRRVIGRWKRDD